ncbi:diacylglycerol/lipid kinase family protein [Krasilnikoviella flava]|uniref:Diacylglycerol kinase family enzyme n=1 Tax=Krasilnikoviella flava TaxID=526729 RepID=A0A1T5JYA9_9MICO|nr:diacylglycerol kinase family protein [Krasilnikoviella flava]SKC56326.1 Diacylglycerol kinase family enzyme [Krasilnikoviella flava]
MPDEYAGIVALVVALVVALGALVALLVVWRRARTQQHAVAERDAQRTRDGEARGMLLAVVINPSKEGAADVRAVVERVCAEAALPDPLFYETAVDDPGTGQARQALADGADVVVAAGGDGTVRAVAEALAGTGHPMGLIPVGTGNLLARNLDLPLTSVPDAVAVVVGGTDRAIDVGRARVSEFAPDAEPLVDGDPHRAHIFLVIAGLGFDAAMVADADDQLKARVGWVAYFLAGARHLHGRRMRAIIRLDDGEAVEARLRSIMVGNCGRLPGGLTLLPDAVIDDGELDVAAIDTRGGLAGWAQLLGEVVAQGLGVRNDLPGKIGRIDHTRARRAVIRVDDGEQAQVDGDPLGSAVELETWVEPGALVVRTG